MGSTLPVTTDAILGNLPEGRHAAQSLHLPAKMRYRSGLSRRPGGRAAGPVARSDRQEMKTDVKRQRATIIVELDGRILLVENRGGLVLLPGGGVHMDESRLQAAARELSEETRLVAQSLLFLFDHESPTNRHAVFWAAASGAALAGDDATALHLFTAGDAALGERMSAASRQIIERFLDLPRDATGVPRLPASALERVAMDARTSRARSPT